MQKVKFVLYLALTLAFCWALNGKRGPLPPVGKLLDPLHGFWQNCETETHTFSGELDLPGLTAPVTVHYDERRVPHIFAQNEADLFRAQGYVTARDRLWQMEFQTMAAGGRLSEIINNPRVLQLDRMNRRRGMGYAAEKTNDYLKTVPEAMAILNAYTEGVNAYIHSLCYAQLPFEYKLLDYQPEDWSPLKTALLLKMMANNLSGRTEDFPNSNSITLMGPDHFANFYPELPDSIDPIIPAGTPWEFEPVSLDTPRQYVPTQIAAQLEYPRINPHNGSNNWAVSGKKTASGYPILCNDPHLGMSLPSIWYEMQLNAPGINTYGATLPGAPLTIIGFNESVAWGVTNSSRDVLDWYQIEFKDGSRREYKFDDQWLPTEFRVEEIKVRDGATVYDTVVYTQHGPVVYDRNFGDSKGAAPINLAMRWTAHDPSNEMNTFYGMAKAQNYKDYREAISHFQCPGQNFVFAAKDGDIAITQQGKFPAKWKDQGKFILDGNNPLHLWQKFIPTEQNPTVYNPDRGFVSSANQHPVDSTYPYGTPGYYEYYRNRVINRELAGMDKITAEDMMKLQKNNHNLLASENLPFMLDSVQKGDLTGEEIEYLETLKGWNYQNNGPLRAPAIFEAWEMEIFRFFSQVSMDFHGPVAMPTGFTISQILTDPKCSYLLDKGFFLCPSSIPTLVTQAFKAAVRSLKEWQKETGMELTWANYNDVHIMHLARLEPLGRYNIQTGGNRSIVNATHDNHGPSWRMVIELGPEVKAWGIIPGGESGNPGSSFYANGVDDWAEGNYYPLHLLKPGDAQNPAILSTQTFKAP